MTVRLRAVVAERHSRTVAVEVVDAHVRDVEEQRKSGRQPSSDEVLDHFLLPVDRDGRAGQLGEVDAVRAVVEPQRGAVVHEPFSREPLADAHLVQEVDGWLFQHSGADAMFDVVAAAGLEDDRLDALQVQQVRQASDPAGPAPMTATCWRTGGLLRCELRALSLRLTRLDVRNTNGCSH